MEIGKGKKEKLTSVEHNYFNIKRRNIIDIAPFYMFVSLYLRLDTSNLFKHTNNVYLSGYFIMLSVMKISK